MIKTCIIYFLTITVLNSVNAQTTYHNNTWYFGCGQTVQFTPSGPVAGIGLPAVPTHNLYTLHSGNGHAAVAVNDAQGALQFFVQFKSIIQPSAAASYVANTPKVFDRLGQPFLHGNIAANYADGNSGNPLVVPHPGNAQQYYLLYVHNAALLYSLVDMSLNNGMGDIVANQKDIVLMGYGTVIGRKITLVQGCYQKLWLVARSRTANAYYGFAFTPQGITPTPVVSVVGTQPVSSYRSINGGYHGGVLSASNDGRYLVAGTDKGIEWYDFEPCSGQVKNARMLDTLATLGLCFSPDDTKLYATAMERRLYPSNVPGVANFYPLGRVYQYDLVQPDILASRTQVLENPIKVCLSMAGYIDTVSSWLGDIKRGADDKLYIASNTTPCNILTLIGAIPVWPSTSVVVEQVLHRINQPNQAGMACLPQYNAVLLAGSPTLSTGFMLPQDIKTVPTSAPDTLPSRSFTLVNCFADSFTLAGDTAAACYLWDDGSTDSIRRVVHSGTYWLRYSKHCSIRTDTFHVSFIPLPQVPELGYGCPGEGSITIPAADSHTVFHYTVYDANGTVVNSTSGTGAQNISHLYAGDYTLHINAASCDTTLSLSITEFPKPTLVVSPTDTTLRHGDTIQLQVSGAYIYTWSPTAQLDTATKANPMAWPRKPTRYEVVGINEYGCRDVAHINIDINYDMPEFVPNAFSPNGDGLNDVFKLSGITFHKLSVFKVFNRYGHEVYNGSDPMQGWDGNSHGKPCDVGTYYYLIGLVYPDGKVKTLKGDVSLIR